MPSRVQIIEAFWEAVPAGAGFAELAAGIQVVVQVAGRSFIVDTAAEAAFRGKPCDRYLLLLEDAAVFAAMAVLTMDAVAA